MSQTAGTSRLWAVSQFENQEGDSYAGVRGGRDGGRGAAAGVAARGPWAPGGGDDDEPGQAGFTAAAGRGGDRDGRAWCDVGRRGGGQGPAGHDGAPDDRN